MHRSSAAQFSVLSNVVIKDLTTQITVLSEGIDALLRTHGYFSKKGALMGKRKSQACGEANIRKEEQRKTT